MAKITLTDIAAGYLSIATYNANNTLIETALENTLSRDGTSPNTMSADLDMNSNQISNLPTPTATSHATNKAYVDAVAIAASAGDMQAANNLSDVDSAVTSLVNLGLTATAAEINLLDLSGLTAGYVLSADTASTASWKAAAASGISNVVEDVTPQLGATLDANTFNIDMGTNVLTDTSLGQHDTAYGWGDHSVAGYLTTVAASDITAGNLASTVDPYVLGSNTSSSFCVVFTDSTSGTSANSALLKDSGAALTYNPLVNTLTAGAFSGTLNASSITGCTIEDYGLTSNSLTVSANAVACDLSTGNAFEVDLEAATGTVTITLSNPPASGTYGECIIKVQQDTTASRAITWAGGTFAWPGGAAPTMSTAADAIDIYTFKTWDAGTTWYGDVSQAYA